MVKKLTQEQIDGIDSQIRQESIPYTYDTKEYPVEVLVGKYAKDELFVPHYQRQFVWDAKQKSRFIESVFLGVPIMPLLVSISGEDSVFEIIDGSQRIRTLVEYVVDGNYDDGKPKNGLKLQGLKKLIKLNGTFFRDLPTGVKNKFKYRDFRFHVVTENATNEIRADIFDRVNTSAKSLTASEVRKGALQGKFYDFVLECSKSEKFKKLCPIPKAKADRGEYEELILRFFAYSESYLNFKHDVAPFLDQYVQSQAGNFDEDAKRNELNQVLDFVEMNFPEPYFSRRGRDNATPRVRFEAISVGVHLALKIDESLKPAYMDWLESKEFKEYTTSDASNNQGKLVRRVEFVRDCLLNKIKKEDLDYE